MGYVKEPEGVDFVINGKPLTNEQKQRISEFIKADKGRLASLQKARENRLARQQGMAKNNA